MARNRCIVDSVQLLVATPFEHREVIRSGTWATVRYARKRQVPVIIIWPSGELG